MTLHEGRVRISLNPFSTVIATGSLLLLIFAAYVLGLKTAPSSRPLISAKAEPSGSTIAKALTSPADSSVIELPRVGTIPTRTGTPKTNSGRKPPAKPPGAAVGADTREPGLNYLLIVTIDKRQDAEHAQAFLNAHGVKTTIVRDTGRFLLYDVTRGYRYGPDETLWKAQKAKLAALTDTYTKQGGRYRFNDTLLKLYKP